MPPKEFLAEILVPIDGSASSVMAQEVAARVASKTGASVTVLNIVPRQISFAQTDSTYNVPNQITTDVIGRLERDSEKIISDAELLFDQEKVPVKTEILRDEDPPEAVLQYSKNDFDLIVIGAHGDKEAKEPQSLGSVARKVAMHAESPVLIVKEATPILKILVCVTDSDRSLKVYDLALKLAEKMNSEIALINVQEKPVHSAAPEVAKRETEKVFSRIENRTEKEKTKVTRIAEMGVPTNRIVDVADRGEYDLIVLGNRKSGRTRKLVRGSVSQTVSEKTTKSVLLVPTDN